MASAYPVSQDLNTGQRYHEAKGYKQLKDLVEATQTYRVSASFTLGLVEHLGQSAMTPADWMSTVKACVSLGQYLDFQSIYTDLAIAQARTNAANGNAAWMADMLLGEGQWINNQFFQYKYISRLMKWPLGPGSLCPIEGKCLAT